MLRRRQNLSANPKRTAKLIAISRVCIGQTSSYDIPLILAIPPLFHQSFPDGQHRNAAYPEPDPDPAGEMDLFPKKNQRQQDPQNDRAGK